MTANAPRLALLVAPGGSAGEGPALGAFSGIVEIALPEAGSERAARLAAVAAAEEAGCDWLLRIGEAETLRPHALAVAAPALSAYAAIFGAVSIRGEGLWRPSRLAFDEAAMLPHALLNWWVGDAPLIRTEMERRVLEALPDGPVDAALHAEAVFASGPAIKLATPFVERETPPPELPGAARAALAARLAETPVFLAIPYGEAVYRLPYTGGNAGIEREQTRGLFFEAAELEALKHRVGPGAVVADIGANTGNHMVFFAGPMRAGRVVPFEPLPELGAVLRRTVEENGFSNVDLSHLGIGLSDRAGAMRIRRSERGGFGASRLEADETGEIAVARLDDVLTGPVDLLKIDVESMEMQVLKGAEATISRCRPVIFIEIAHDNTMAFMAWAGDHRYRIERMFSDKGHANYLLAPVGG